MWIKQSGGKVFGATFTAKEQKAIDIEINRQILEADEKYQNNIDASVLYALRVYAGWGPKKLRDFYESFGPIHDDLRAYYEMPDDTLETDPAVRLNYQIEKVEDLIMQEEALEFAFEGYRFYDLMRVALRRNDPSYLADKVYQRKGAENVGVMRAAIRCDLTDTRNWYLNWNDKIGLGY